MSEIIPIILGSSIGIFVAIILIIHGYTDILFDWLLDGINVIVAVMLLIVFLVFVMICG